MVERMHRVLNNSIATLINTNTHRWDEVLNDCVLALNVRKHSVTGFSAFRLLYGIDPRLPQEFCVPRQVTAPLDDVEKRNLILDRTAQELDSIGQNRAAAYQRSLKQASKWTNGQTEHNFRFEIGQMVKRKRFNAQKFENNWTGPFFIVEYGFPFTYWLQTPDGRRLESTVNESHLAPWIERNYFNAEVQNTDGLFGNSDTNVADSINMSSAVEEGDIVNLGSDLGLNEG